MPPTCTSPSRIPRSFNANPRAGKKPAFVVATMNFLRTPCLIAISALIQTCAAQETTLTIQGDEYKSACAPIEREALKQQVTQAALGRQGESLATLVLSVLCGKGEKSNDTVRQASIVPLKFTSTSTGSERATVTTIARAKLTAYAAAAWNASVETGSDGVDVHFYKNEACIETLTFRNLAKTWRLAAIAQACD
jgi:hypothetical protein